MANKAPSEMTREELRAALRAREAADPSLQYTYSYRRVSATGKRGTVYKSRGELLAMYEGRNTAGPRQAALRPSTRVTAQPTRHRAMPMQLEFGRGNVTYDARDIARHLKRTRPRWPIPSDYRPPPYAGVPLSNLNIQRAMTMTGRMRRPTDDHTPAEMYPASSWQAYVSRQNLRRDRTHDALAAFHTTRNRQRHAANMQYHAGGGTQNVYDLMRKNELERDARRLGIPFSSRRLNEVRNRLQAHVNAQQYTS